MAWETPLIRVMGGAFHFWHYSIMESKKDMDADAMALTMIALAVLVALVCLLLAVAVVAAVVGGISYLAVLGVRRYRRQVVEPAYTWEPVHTRRQVVELLPPSVQGDFLTREVGIPGRA